MQFVLVHGSWHGGWCWEPFIPYLSKHGKASCIDLPGHALNQLPAPLVTYDAYYKCVENEILSHSKPVVLVAHSMSGILAAPLLDRYPERIAHLFLISAYVALKGQTLLDLALSGGPSEIPFLIIDDGDPFAQTLDRDKAKSAFYRDCSPEIAEWAASQLQPQPLLPLKTPILWNDSGQTIHKRTYILCEEDRDVHPITQQNIINQYPCQVVSMKSGHFPFLSNPQELLRLIILGLRS